MDKKRLEKIPGIGILKAVPANQFMQDYMLQFVMEGLPEEVFPLLTEIDIPNAALILTYKGEDFLIRVSHEYSHLTPYRNSFFLIIHATEHRRYYWLLDMLFESLDSAHQYRMSKISSGDNRCISRRRDG